MRKNQKNLMVEVWDRRSWLHRTRKTSRFQKCSQKAKLRNEDRRNFNSTSCHVRLHPNIIHPFKPCYLYNNIIACPLSGLLNTVNHNLIWFESHLILVLFMLTQSMLLRSIGLEEPTHTYISLSHKLLIGESNIVTCFQIFPWNPQNFVFWGTMSPCI